MGRSLGSFSLSNVGPSDYTAATHKYSTSLLLLQRFSCSCLQIIRMKKLVTFVTLINYHSCCCSVSDAGVWGCNLKKANLNVLFCILLLYPLMWEAHIFFGFFFVFFEDELEESMAVRQKMSLNVWVKLMDCFLLLCPWPPLLPHSSHLQRRLSLSPDSSCPISCPHSLHDGLNFTIYRCPLQTGSIWQRCHWCVWPVLTSR